MQKLSSSQTDTKQAYLFFLSFQLRFFIVSVAMVESATFCVPVRFTVDPQRTWIERQSTDCWGRRSRIGKIPGADNHTFHCVWTRLWRQSGHAGYPQIAYAHCSSRLTYNAMGWWQGRHRRSRMPGGRPRMQLCQFLADHESIITLSSGVKQFSTLTKYCIMWSRTF